MMGRHDGGFTLVESLVAFSILAAAVVLSFQLSGASLHRLERSKSVTQQVKDADEFMQLVLRRKDLRRSEWTERYKNQDWLVSVTARRPDGLAAAGMTASLLLIRVEPAPPAEGPALEAIVSSSPAQ